MEDLELIHAQVFFRHGARAPFSDSGDFPLIWNRKLQADPRSCPPIRLLDLSTHEPVSFDALKPRRDRDNSETIELKNYFLLLSVP